MNVKIQVGAMVPDITEQLDNFGLCVSGADFYQKDLDAVTRLLVRGFMPASAAKTSRDRIIKEIFKRMKEKERAE